MRGETDSKRTRSTNNMGKDEVSFRYWVYVCIIGGCAAHTYIARCFFFACMCYEMCAHKALYDVYAKYVQ